MSTRPARVSIVCVFNDPHVRQDCLDRSIAAFGGDGDRVDYIPVDNVAGQFPSAGAALNHGASRARHDVVVLVHQDVYLHSLDALEAAAGLLTDDRNQVGLLGACGIDGTGDIVGRVRDRVVLVGRPVGEGVVVDVDSVDEVLFMVRKDQLRNEPLAQDPDLAWHAYAVEYGLRMRTRGLRCVVADIPLTHNSLTVNLARLDEAHGAVARAYPALLPVRTTCGVVSDRPSIARSPAFASHRWRYRWLRRSVRAHVARRAMGGGSVVLDDIRLDVDDVLAATPGRFDVVNVVPDHAGRAAMGEPVVLSRRGVQVRFSCSTPQELGSVVAGLAGGPLLVTNLRPADLGVCIGTLGGVSHVAGYHEAFGLWLLAGADVRPLREWGSRPATPLGMKALV